MGNPIANWRKRHRKAANFWLHMLGIGACFVAAPVLGIMRQPLEAVMIFVAGYALQFIGHLAEGNRSGEQLLLKRLLAGVSQRNNPRRAKPNRAAQNSAPGSARPVPSGQALDPDAHP